MPTRITKLDLKCDFCLLHWIFCDWSRESVWVYYLTGFIVSPAVTTKSTDFSAVMGKILFWKQ